MRFLALALARTRARTRTASAALALARARAGARTTLSFLLASTLALHRATAAGLGDIGAVFRVGKEFTRFGSANFTIASLSLGTRGAGARTAAALAARFRLATALGTRTAARAGSRSAGAAFARMSSNQVFQETFAILSHSSLSLARRR
jgi:hypothetical protein